MENQMTSLKCRKCGATVSADQKKCPKCGAPVLLKVMLEEEKRHLPAKEIREKDKRMRREYDKINKEKEQKRQKEEKKKQLIEQKKEKARNKAKAELESIRQKESAKLEKEEQKRAVKEAKAAAALNASEKDGTETSSGKFPYALVAIISVIILALAVAIFFINRPATEETVTETEVETIQEEEPVEEIIEEEPPEELREEQPEEPAPEVQSEPEPAPEPEPQKEPEPKKESKPEPVRNITRNNYLFPSDTQYLTESDINGLSQYETGLLRNEIYARKGYIFKNEPYKSYFYSQAWYNPVSSAKITLNEIEKYNMDLISEYERAQGWR